MATFVIGDYGVDGKSWRNLLAWVSVSFGFVLLVAPSASAESVFKGDIELFKALAMAQRDNAERISSWQGSSRVEATKTDPNGVLMRDISDYYFITARDHNATRWAWTPTDRYTRKGGKLVADPLKDKKLNEMRKDDSFYKHNLGVETKEGERRGALVIWPVKKAEEGAYSCSFDPMWYLTGQWTGWPDMATGLMKYYQRAKDPNYSSPYLRYTLTRDGPLVTLVRENPTAVMASRFVFDLSKGGTLARYHATMKENVQTIEWTYEEEDGVWIPKTCTKTIERDPPANDGCTKYTRSVAFVENTLNDPVPASEFSLDKLGLRAGDLVSDHKLGTRYRYGVIPDEVTLQTVNLSEDMSAVENQPEAQSSAQGEDERTPPDNIPAEQASSGDANSDQEKALIAQTNNTSRRIVWPIILLAVGGFGIFLLGRRGKARAES